MQENSLQPLQKENKRRIYHSSNNTHNIGDPTRGWRIKKICYKRPKVVAKVEMIPPNWLMWNRQLLKKLILIFKTMEKWEGTLGKD